MAKFEVLREHIGDKEYKAGDTRTADPKVVQHLVDRGTLAPMPAAKRPSSAKAVGRTPKNKAERGAPKNKAEGGAAETK